MFIDYLRMFWSNNTTPDPEMLNLNDTIGHQYRVWKESFFQITATPFTNYKTNISHINVSHIRNIHDVGFFGWFRNANYCWILIDIASIMLIEIKSVLMSDDNDDSMI